MMNIRAEDLSLEVHVGKSQHTIPCHVAIWETHTCYNRRGGEEEPADWATKSEKRSARIKRLNRAVDSTSIIQFDNLKQPYLISLLDFKEQLCDSRTRRASRQNLKLLQELQLYFQIFNLVLPHMSRARGTKCVWLSLLSDAAGEITN